MRKYPAGKTSKVRLDIGKYSDKPKAEGYDNESRYTQKDQDRK
jgi:hypothetical protein